MTLIGIQHLIKDKIKFSTEVFEKNKALFFSDANLAKMLSDYEKAFENTQKSMSEIGMCDICADCAQNTGGSCCGDGIEDWFDSALILINLLLGVKIPEKRLIDKGCWFLGETGCLISAKHTICLNYLCKRLQSELSQEKLRSFQACMLKETELLFYLEERIKKILR
jgi:hypothetical protein